MANTMLNRISWLFTVAAIISYMIMISNGYALGYTFVVRNDAIGKRGTNYILFTLDRATPMACALACKKNDYCMLFFFNKKKRTCSLHNRNLTDITTMPEANSVCYGVYYETVALWITSIIKFSSQSIYHASNIVGPRDRLPWYSSGKYSNDFLEVKIACDLYIEKIFFYEISNPGGIQKISLLSPNGTYQPVWTTKKLMVGYRDQILRRDIQKTYFRTSTIRIDIGARSVKECIDAIRVRGKRPKLA